MLTNLAFMRHANQQQDDDRDLIETPERTDDTSTRPPESETSPNDIGDDEETSGISRVALNAGNARSTFRSNDVDAREADFSDRLDSKRKSYRVSSRRRRESHGNDEYGESSDEDTSTSEGLRRRIARLQREAEELKAELQRQGDSAIGGAQVDGEVLSQLNGAVRTLDTISAGGTGAEAQFAKQLEEAARAAPPPVRGGAAPSVDGATYTLSYQPPTGDAHALALAASFDARLKDLEAALGLASVPLPTQSDAAPRPLVPALDAVEKQVALLATTTPASLDALGKRIRHLTAEAEQLEDKRKAAKHAFDEMRTAATEPSPDKRPPSISVLEDTEMEAKISALYNTLPTIETLAPTLPQVLERLKSLRLLHADAASAASRLEAVDAQGKDVAEEIKLWRRGLENVEAAVAESENTTKKNMAVVESWVQELEERIKVLA